MADVFLGLGSNLGNRLLNLELVVAAVSTLGPVRRSEWYETEPVEMSGASRFLNGVVKVGTRLGPHELLDWVQTLEARLGRSRPAPTAGPGTEAGANPQRYCPRTVDIDILFWGQMAVNDGRLVVPHPRLHERAFVLVPLAELAPQFVHPSLGLSVLEMLARVGRAGVERFS